MMSHVGYSLTLIFFDFSGIFTRSSLNLLNLICKMSSLSSKLWQWALHFGAFSIIYSPPCQMARLGTVHEKCSCQQKDHSCQPWSMTSIFRLGLCNEWYYSALPSLLLPFPQLLEPVSYAIKYIRALRCAHRTN